MQITTLPHAFGGCCVRQLVLVHPLQLHLLHRVLPLVMADLIFFNFSFGFESAIFMSRLRHAQSCVKCSVLHFALFSCVLLGDVTFTLSKISVRMVGLQMEVFAVS